MTEFSADLDRSSPIPLYHQMAEQIHQAIQDGSLEPGSLLGNEIVLADRFGLVPPDNAQGHPGTRRQGCPGPQARRRHPGRAGPDHPIRATHQPLRRPLQGRSATPEPRC